MPPPAMSPSEHKTQNQQKRHQISHPRQDYEAGGGGGVVFVTVRKILEQIVEVVDLSELQVVERIQDSLIDKVVDILVGNSDRFRRASYSFPRQSDGHSS